VLAEIFDKVDKYSILMVETTREEPMQANILAFTPEPPPHLQIFESAIAELGAQGYVFPVKPTTADD
jgi:hypothetical protein